MFTTKSKPKSVPGKAGAPSILSLDLQVTGNIVTSGELHVSGSVKGDIIAQKVTIGEGASVTGAIEAESALVAGAVAGRLTATSVMLAIAAVAPMAPIILLRPDMVSLEVGTIR